MKRPSKLSESLHHRLTSYTLAASAAGVGVFALAQRSEAKVVYTPVHVIITSNHAYYLDLNHDGVTDFIIGDRFHCSGNCLATLLVQPSSAIPNSIVGNQGWAVALRRGQRIGATRQFTDLYDNMAVASLPSQGTFYSGGPWANVSKRYLGLRFKVHHHAYYGWARLSVRISNKTVKIAAILAGYAYETIPNKPIIAGRTHGKDVVTVQDPSLGHLAAGASAIPGWRAKENK